MSVIRRLVICATLLSSAGSYAEAAVITIFPDNPHLSGLAEITTTEPRAGNASVDLSTGPYLVYEYALSSGLSFGTWGDLTGLLYEGFVTGSNLQRPGFALRLNYFGESDTFFVTATDATQAADTWITHNVFGDWVLQTADGLPFLPPSIDAIPADTPITGIHFRDAAFAGTPYLGFADNASLRFGTTALTTYNFETVQAIPEPTSIFLIGTGMALLGARARNRSKLRKGL
jgi:hypothetical protein